MKLTSINANYTDISKMTTSDGKSGKRLLEQLLEGVGTFVDYSLAGLLGNQRRWTSLENLRLTAENSERSEFTCAG